MHPQGVCPKALRPRWCFPRQFRLFSCPCCLHYMSLWEPRPFFANWLCWKQKHNLRCLGGALWERMGVSDMKHRSWELTEVILSFILQLFPNKSSSCQPNHSSPTFSSSNGVLLKTSFFLSFLLFFGHPSWEGSQFPYQGLNSGIAVTSSNPIH